MDVVWWIHSHPSSIPCQIFEEVINEHQVVFLAKKESNDHIMLKCLSKNMISFELLVIFLHLNVILKGSLFWLCSLSANHTVNPSPHTYIDLNLDQFVATYRHYGDIFMYPICYNPQCIIGCPPPSFQKMANSPS